MNLAELFLAAFMGLCAFCAILGLAALLFDDSDDKPLPKPDDPRLRNVEGILEWKAKRAIARKKGLI